MAPNAAQIEAAARIIDPDAWALHDRGLSNPVWGDVPLHLSLQKARDAAQIFEPRPDDTG